MEPVIIAKGGVISSPFGVQIKHKLLDIIGPVPINRDFIELNPVDWSDWPGGM